MALVRDGMTCTICGAPNLNIGRDAFATTASGIDHPQFKALDDAAVH